MFYVDEDDRVVGHANIAVTQGGEMVPSPDAVLLQACAAARAAAAACNGETVKDDPGDIETLLDREVAALRRVAGIKARTAHGVVEKAFLLQDCAGSLSALTLALSLAEDVVALVG